MRETKEWKNPKKMDTMDESNAAAGQAGINSGEEEEKGNHACEKKSSAQGILAAGGKVEQLVHELVYRLVE